MHHFTPLTSHVFLFLAFIQFASNSPHIQSCTRLAKKKTLFTFCSSSSSSPLSCYIITAAISKPRAAFLRPSRGDMTFMHQKLPREREEIGRKRQDSSQSLRRFLRSESALFTRACWRSIRGGISYSHLLFLFPLIYHDWAPLPNRNASATAAMTQDLYSAQIFLSRNWLDDRLTNAAWRRRRKGRKRYVLQTSNAWNYSSNYAIDDGCLTSIHQVLCDTTRTT